MIAAPPVDPLGELGNNAPQPAQVEWLAEQCCRGVLLIRNRSGRYGPNMTTSATSPGIGAVPAVGARPESRVRRGAFGMVFGLMIQFTAGMLVYLFTKIPDSHPGSNPAEYFTGSLQSVIWAITQSGLPPLMFHARP